MNNPYQGYIADNSWSFHHDPAYAFGGNEWSQLQNAPTRETWRRGGKRRRNTRRRGGHGNVAYQPNVQAEVQNYLDTGIQPAIAKMTYGEQGSSLQNSIKTKTNHVQSQTKKKGNATLNISLDTPEQIAQWREERRKNYPSASNIAKKQERSQAKKESGQTAVGDKYRYINSSWKCDNKRGVNQASRNTKSIQQQHEPLKLCGTEDESATIQEDVIDAADKPHDQHILTVKGSLGALSDIYGVGSSDEEVGEARINNCDTIMEQQSFETVTPRVNDISDKKKTMGINNEHRKQNTMKKRRTIRASTMNAGEKRRKPGLLQMLLTPDIRHERNVLLQCIRHIVRKDFFASSSHK